jgi:hypothetical protein
MKYVKKGSILIYSLCGKHTKAGSTTRKLLGFQFPNAPQSFLDGFKQIGTHEYFYLYPIFWQSFFWLFGGFILKDYEKEDYEALSRATGIPVDQYLLPCRRTKFFSRKLGVGLSPFRLRMFA